MRRILYSHSEILWYNMQRLNFNTWLENENMPMAHKKTKLVIFDFDGTLANVPERHKDWAGKDWWGHPDSLSQPYYNDEVNHEVVKAFQAANADPDAAAILLTGRRGIISPSVRRVLRSNDLHGKRIIPDSNRHLQQKHAENLKAGHDEERKDYSHEEYYAGDHNTELDYPQTPKGKPDGTTLAHKFYVIRKLIHEYTESVEFWEDREDHIPSFIKLGLDLLNEYGVKNGGHLNSVMLHRVYPPSVKGGQSYIQHIPIKKGMVY